MTGSYDDREALVAELAATKAHVAGLERSLESHRRLIENARDMVWQTDLEGRLLYVNAYCEDLLGHSPTESVGHTMQEYFSGASARAVAKGVRETLLASPPQPYFQAEVEYRHKDGHVVPGEVRIAAERDATGRIVALNGVSRGIAARKQAEAELHKQRAFFEQVFTQSSVSTQILDKDGWCERVNSKLSEVFGVLPEHIEGRVYNIFKDEGIRQGGVLPHLERVFREGKTAEWEVHFDIGVAADSQGIQVKEKKRVWFYNWAYPIFDDAGALSHVIIQHTDITDRKRTLKALEDSEARHRTLFEKSPNALLTLAPPAWCFTSANPAALVMFGVSREADLVARGPAELSPERQLDGRLSAEKSLELIETAMRDATHSFEWTHRRVSGEDFPATVRLARMEVDGQQLLQATVTDETDKTRLQAGLAQSDRLASMGMLAAGIAHEINNPLAYVLSSVEVLAEQVPKLAETAQRAFAALEDQVGSEAAARLAGDDLSSLTPAARDDLVEAAESALEGTRRITSISRGLSTFSRLESVECTKVDVRAAIDAAVAMAHNELKYRAVLVKQYRDVPSVWASEGKLSQVFLNLLINAAHAIPDGQSAAHRITVRVWPEGDDVLAEVADTGSGISPENLDRIFEPFFTTKGPGKGSGLGLPICKTLIGELGGELRVESELGKGTRFVVRLPRDRAGHAGDPEAKPSSPALPGPAVRGRILVVDDEAMIRRGVHRLLAREHEVAIAESGREAQALLREDAAFDVILCDLMMPDMTGMELHEWLAAHDPALAERIVFVSGGAFTPKATDYLASVSNLRIEKPFDPSKLRTMVGDLVRAVRGAK